MAVVNALQKAALADVDHGLAPFDSLESSVQPQPRSSSRKWLVWLSCAAGLLLLMFFIAGIMLPHKPKSGASFAASDSAPDDRATLYNLMLALRKTGRLEEAKPIEKRIAELQQQGDRASEVGFAASGLNNEGIRLEKSGDIRAALAKYRAALDLDPTGFGFRLNYALALCRLARWQDGVVELREVLRVDPDNADAAKALYIAIEQAKAQPEDLRKSP